MSAALSNVLQSLLPAFETELGGAFTVEHEVVRIPDGDGFQVVMAATLRLPPAYRRWTFAPSALVAQSPQEMITGIVEERLKPFARDMQRAGADTLTTWTMATQ